MTSRTKIAVCVLAAASSWLLVIGILSVGHMALKNVDGVDLREVFSAENWSGVRHSSKARRWDITPANGPLPGTVYLRTG